MTARHVCSGVLPASREGHTGEVVYAVTAQGLTVSDQLNTPRRQSCHDEGTHPGNLAISETKGDGHTVLASSLFAVGETDDGTGTKPRVAGTKPSRVTKTSGVTKTAVLQLFESLKHSSLNTLVNFDACVLSLLASMSNAHVQRGNPLMSLHV